MPKSRLVPCALAVLVGLALAADADAGRGKKNPSTVVVTTTTLPQCIPACVPGDPDPPTCTAADGTVIDDATRAAHCETFCTGCSICIASDKFGFPNCKWPSSCP